MRPIIATEFRLATHQVRRCADLRRITIALRLAAHLEDPARTAGTRFPPSLLGSELVSLMSTQLQDRLRQSATAAEESGYSRQLRREFMPTEARTMDRTIWDRLEDNVAQRKGNFEQIDQERGELSAFCMKDSTGTRIHHDGTFAPVSLASGDSSADEALLEKSAVSRPWTSPAPTAGSLHSDQPATVMAKQLRRYWDAEKRYTTRLAESGLDSGKIEQHRKRDHASEGSRSPVPALRFSQATFAQRLHSFVSGAGEPPEHASQRNWSKANETLPGRHLFSLSSMSGAEPALAGEFAEQLSRTLFAQAVQHGIDLT